MMVKTDEFEIDNKDGLFCSTDGGRKAVCYGVGEKPELEAKVNKIMAEIDEKVKEMGELILGETSTLVE